jgi:hypothetical protein
MSSQLFDFGDILLVRDVVDPRGRNPKDRPILCLDDFAAIKTSSMFLGLATSTSFRFPLKPDEVLLYDRLGASDRTGLSRPCVAKCSWIYLFEKDRIIKKLGAAFEHQLHQIIEKLDRLVPDHRRRKPD